MSARASRSSSRPSSRSVSRLQHDPEDYENVAPATPRVDEEGEEALRELELAQPAEAVAQTQADKEPRVRAAPRSPVAAPAVTTELEELKAKYRALNAEHVNLCAKHCQLEQTSSGTIAILEMDCEELKTTVHLAGLVVGLLDL